MLINCMCEIEQTIKMKFCSKLVKNFGMLLSVSKKNVFQFQWFNTLDSGHMVSMMIRIHVNVHNPRQHLSCVMSVEEFIVHENSQTLQIS